DRLGMDTNEAGWIIAWIMECYDKKLLTKNDTDGLEMTWGNVEAAKAMLRKIAYREGIGDLLAEGAMRAAEHLGGEAANLAIYTKKGNTPRGHDHRNNWTMILDVCTSDSSTDETGGRNPPPSSVGLPPETDLFTPEGAAAMLAVAPGKYHFHDSLGICRLTLFGTKDFGTKETRIIEVLNAVTGWDFKYEEMRQLCHRVSNLLRAFNVRHGLTPELEAPSPRYGSAALAGPAPGKSILPVFEEVRNNYYRKMGWDVDTGRPLPATLRSLGLDYVIKDLWQASCGQAGIRQLEERPPES
ncbi:MAG: aldehyde ferredoxin oxidoreductase C-terminal domain-containing protein, partial [Dehalococcoidales bacterium]|nr:aldehyde ferredoxin oxidoreductase C-terminal domain-containing protein [Dehalococcoidales bacterium]